MVSSDNKPLPELMLTQIHDALWLLNSEFSINFVGFDDAYEHIDKINN